MSWRADQIYTLPDPKIIEEFKKISQLKDKLFLVTDLEGIRSEWTRNLIFAKEDNDYTKQRYCLPKDGLLSIAPKIYGTGYDKNINFWKTQNIENEYNIEQTKTDNNLLNDFGFDEDHLNLFNFLTKLNKETNTPIFHYSCEMWGGDIDEEFAIVFDNDCFVYYRDIDTGETKDIKNNIITETNPLQKGLSHLGIELPTWFFALHECSFDWEKYQIK